MELIRQEKHQAYLRYVHQRDLLARLGEQLDLHLRRRSATRLVRYLRRHFFLPTDNDISQIEGRYLYRLTLTAQHLGYEDPTPLMTIGVDLQDVAGQATVRYQEVEYVLSPIDQDRIRQQWARVNPSTSSGIRYASDRAYDRSLCRDRMK